MKMGDSMPMLRHLMLTHSGISDQVIHQWAEEGIKKIEAFLAYVSEEG